MSEGVPLPDAAVAALEAAVKRYLALDPEGARRLADLHGRVILVEVAGFGTRLYLIPGPGGLQLFGRYPGAPDCTLRGSPAALARMGLSRRREDQLFSGEVRIEGDTDLAQAFGDLLAGLDVDWEEQLSRLTGDPIAHRVGSGVRALGRWGARSADTLFEDVRDYLQEEGRLLPTHYEAQEFLDEVDRLRDDTERLAARIDRLANKRRGSAGER